MRVYYFSRRRCSHWAVGFLGLMIAAYLLGTLLMGAKTVTASKLAPIYQGSSEKKQVSFAVNVDWGEEYLPAMLQLFEKNNVQATFFLTGRWAEKFPELAGSIAQKGHEIGNHGFSHSSPNMMSLEKNKAEIIKSAEIIFKCTGKKTELYAPPSGESAEHVIKAAHEMGYRTILWSVDTVDWQRPQADVIVQRVISKVHNGAIILMHPTAPTVEALPSLIRELKAGGYSFVTVSENIKDK